MVDVPVVHTQPLTVVTRVPVFEYIDKYVDVPVVRVRQVPQVRTVEKRTRSVREQPEVAKIEAPLLAKIATSQFRSSR